MPNLRLLAPFQQGLRNDDNPIGVNALLDAYGVECKETGLVAYKYLPTPIAMASSSGTVAKRHALFTVGTGCYLFDNDNAFKEISSSWAKTTLTPLDYRESQLSSELVLNGDFSAGATYWHGSTSSDAVWGISAGVGASIGLPFSGSRDLYQTWSSKVTCPCCLIRVTTLFGAYDTTTSSGGLLTNLFESQGPLLVNGLPIYTSGTKYFLYKEPTGLSAGITFTASSGWVGVIRDVSVKVFPTFTLTDPMPVIGWNVADHINGFICSGWDYASSEGHPFYYDEDKGFFYHINMHVASICSHVDGRMYMAGRLGTFIRGDTSGYIWRRLTDGSLEMLHTNETPILDDRCVYWSCIGMDDIPGIFFPYLETDEDFLNRWERNEAGFMMWDYPGSIYRLLSLGNVVMVYGENGMAFLQPVFSPITVGIHHLGEIGLRGRMAIDGDDSTHYFVDSDGYLWRVTPGPKPERLGYKEQLSTLSVSGTIVVKHPSEDKVYITDETTSYMYSGGVLVECPECVYSIVKFSNEVAATRKLLTDSFEAETGVIDFGNRDVKTLSRLTYDGYASSSGFYAKTFYRMNRADAWADTGWVKLPVDDRISAREFKFGIKANSSSSAYFSYLDVEFDARPDMYSLGEWIS